MSRDTQRTRAAETNGPTDGVGNETTGNAAAGSEAGGVHRRSVLKVLGASMGTAGLASTADLTVADACSSDSRIDVTAVGTNGEDYPRVDTQVQIKTEAAEAGYDDIGEVFTVREENANGETTVRPLNSSCSKKLDEAGGGKVDIAFVVDDSHSMGGYIDTIEDNAVELANNVQKKGLDGRFAMITFYDDNDNPPYADDGDDRVERDVGFTRDASQLQNVFSDGGNNEPNLDAIWFAATDLNWRDDAQKVIINVCDESNNNSNDHTYSTVLTEVKDRNITVHGILDPNDGDIQSLDLVNHEKIGGTLINIEKNRDFAKQLNDIFQEITRGQYKLCFETAEPCNGEERTVSVCVDDPDAGRIQASSSYTAPTEGSGCNRPPTADFSTDHDEVVPVAGEPITFDAGDAGDPDGEIVSYEWDFDGDGTTDATGRVVEHTFETSGHKPVTLTVVDDDGETDTATAFEVGVDHEDPRLAVGFRVDVALTPGRPVDVFECTDTGGRGGETGSGPGVAAPDTGTGSSPGGSPGRGPGRERRRIGRGRDGRRGRAAGGADGDGDPDEPWINSGPNPRCDVPIGIRGTADFDPVEAIDVESLRLATPEVAADGGGAAPLHGGHAERVMPYSYGTDPHEDLVVHFPAAGTGLTRDSTELKLVGRTADGRPLVGRTPARYRGGGSGRDGGEGGGAGTRGGRGR